MLPPSSTLLSMTVRRVGESIDASFSNVFSRLPEIDWTYPAGSAAATP